VDTGIDLHSRLPRLRYWTTSGEALSPALVTEFKERLPGRTLLNLYGSSEIAGDATARECTGELETPIAPIGRPIDNTTAYILDKFLSPVPIGVRGTLYVGGLNLARGYFNQPELTAESFIPDPFSNEPGARLYRTGDLARYMPDGTIEYLGRGDSQVKVRGFRVELGEIEAVLREHFNIRDAVVVLNDNSQLAMYIVARHHPPPALRDVQAYLRAKLPGYMVPPICIVMDDFPRTPNGKILRASLPRAKQLPGNGDGEYVAPQTPTEERLAAIWSRVLKIVRPGRRDTFFEAGGHSLLATQLVSRIREEFQVELPLRAVFEGQTIQLIAAAIDELHSSSKAVEIAAIAPISRVQRSRANRA